MDCVFCEIVAGRIPSDKVYEDEQCVVFHDISPAAPVHLLVVPKKHIESLMQAEDAACLGHLLIVARQQAVAKGISETGFRVVVNTGEQGGQTVPHLHVHVLGGRNMQWPPG